MLLNWYVQFTVSYICRWSLVCRVYIGFPLQSTVPVPIDKNHPYHGIYNVLLLWLYNKQKWMCVMTLRMNSIVLKLLVSQIQSTIVCFQDLYSESEKPKNLRGEKEPSCSSEHIMFIASSRLNWSPVDISMSSHSQLYVPGQPRIWSLKGHCVDWYMLEESVPDQSEQQ